jgi:hypothetical protein
MDMTTMMVLVVVVVGHVLSFSLGGSTRHSHDTV